MTVELLFVHAVTLLAFSLLLNVLGDKNNRRGLFTRVLQVDPVVQYSTSTFEVKLFFRWWYKYKIVFYIDGREILYHTSTLMYISPGAALKAAKKKVYVRKESSSV